MYPSNPMPKRKKLREFYVTLDNFSFNLRNLVYNRDVKTCRFSIKMSKKLMSNRHNISLDSFKDISIYRH